jgi:hypothetical protein
MDGDGEKRKTALTPAPVLPQRHITHPIGNASIMFVFTIVRLSIASAAAAVAAVNDSSSSQLY